MMLLCFLVGDSGVLSFVLIFCKALLSAVALIPLPSWYRVTICEDWNLFAIWFYSCCLFMMPWISFSVTRSRPADRVDSWVLLTEELMKVGFLVACFSRVSAFGDTLIWLLC